MKSIICKFKWILFRTSHICFWSTLLLRKKNVFYVDLYFVHNSFCKKYTKSRCEVRLKLEVCRVSQLPLHAIFWTSPICPCWKKSLPSFVLILKQFRFRKLTTICTESTVVLVMMNKTAFVRVEWRIQSDHFLSLRLLVWCPLHVWFLYSCYSLANGAAISPCLTISLTSKSYTRFHFKCHAELSLNWAPCLPLNSESHSCDTSSRFTKMAPDF